MGVKVVVELWIGFFFQEVIVVGWVKIGVYKIEGFTWWWLQVDCFV
jgi:hypothetical protein